MIHLFLSSLLALCQLIGVEVHDSVPVPEATIIFAGDAMQHQKQLDVARRSDGTYDYSECFAQIAPYIKSADYAVVNLETTLGEKNFTGYPCFCSPDSYASTLKDVGFDMMLTANNHTLDRRDSGLRRTVKVLERLGVDHIGTYTNRAERDSILPKVVDINGFKVGFLNYTYGTNGIKIQSDVVVDYINEAQIKSDVSKLRDAGAEIIAVAMHWGDEYKLLPNAAQKQQAKMLQNLGVDLIIGGHPHVIQPIEIHTNPQTGRQQLLVYSMGNLISNMTTRDTRGGILVKVWLARDSDGKAIFKSAEYLPVFTLPGGQPGNKQFRLVPVDTYDGPFRLTDCRAWNKAATDIFEKHNSPTIHRSTFFSTPAK